MKLKTIVSLLIVTLLQCGLSAWTHNITIENSELTDKHENYPDNSVLQNDEAEVGYIGNYEKDDFLFFVLSSYTRTANKASVMDTDREDCDCPNSPVENDRMRIAHLFDNITYLDFLAQVNDGSTEETTDVEDGTESITSDENQQDCGPITEAVNAELCAEMRSQQDDIKIPRFSYAERRLLELAGVDFDTMPPAVIKATMATFWERYYKCLECHNVAPPFPRGNYLKQLASSNYTRQLATFLRTYKFPPNIIDETDGCTALDYVEAQIRRTPASSTATHEYLQEAKRLLLREGAKSANELGGDC